MPVNCPNSKIIPDFNELRNWLVRKNDTLGEIAKNFLLGIQGLFKGFDLAAWDTADWAFRLLTVFIWRVEEPKVEYNFAFIHSWAYRQIIESGSCYACGCHISKRILQIRVHHSHNAKLVLQVCHVIFVAQCISNFDITLYHRSDCHLPAILKVILLIIIWCIAILRSINSISQNHC